MATLVHKVQTLIVVVLIALLTIVVLLSTAHLAVLLAQEIWHQPRFLIPVQGLLELFGFFLLVLIGVELLDTLKVYLKSDVIHVRVVIEVALIAVARKVITVELSATSAAALFAMATLVLALGITLYLEHQAHGGHADSPVPPEPVQPKGA